MPARALPSLKGYSTPELKSLLEEIRLTIKKQESSLLRELRKRARQPVTKIEEPPVKEKSPAPKPVEVAPVVRSTLTLSNVVKRQPETAPAPVSGAIKYMHPANRNMTWDGVGKQPDWLKAYMDRGGSWTALENTAEKFASIKPFKRCI